ncbi:MAG: 50S ribosomal protein L18 [Saprospiraceae bacterium]|nr:50S ribosomal protein L18 [Saprospiraceae bacterium]MDW8229477.1 50S ribosomal protein L18 [Saprospiraceae bacterium]
MKRTRQENRKRIHLRIRKKIAGSPERPRLSVYRSNKEIYCQLIDDTKGHTLAAASSREINGVSATKTEKARQVGKLIAEKARASGIELVVFDRGGYLYHGRVKALAEGAREGGLRF